MATGMNIMETNDAVVIGWVYATVGRRTNSFIIIVTALINAN